jgi:hypothetical protein
MPTSHPRAGEQKFSESRQIPRSASRSLQTICPYVWLEIDCHLECSYSICRDSVRQLHHIIGPLSISWLLVMQIVDTY